MAEELLSPELRMDGGIRLKDVVAASYRAALLSRTSSPGSKDCRIVRVALQQAMASRPRDGVSALLWVGTSGMHGFDPSCQPF
jgi:hypothetical protein